MAKVINKDEFSQQTSIIQNLPEVNIKQSRNSDEDRVVAVDGVIVVEVEEHQQQQTQTSTTLHPSLRLHKPSCQWRSVPEAWCKGQSQI